jgi:UDP-N-acetylmuramate: L-alanyl-gamma-D-glutamyl-meso-diaminopimelate ligase
MLAWILEDTGNAPGFLIGGIPTNFGVSARIGDSRYFVVEADEYDTAFFDKRAKFVHYSPQTLILNNLEFDHADIYDDIADIRWQFHQLLRTVPSNARILQNIADENLQEVIDMGCWTPVETFGSGGADWTGEFTDSGERAIRISCKNGETAKCKWQLGGSYNLENAVAAVAAARSAGVSLESAVDAMSRFEGVKRRMERTATVSGIGIYDDFAHHPTAIRRSIAALKKRFPTKRIIVALEPRSNTMKLGVHNFVLADSLSDASLAFIYRPADFPPDFDDALAGVGERLQLFDDYDRMVEGLADELRSDDQLVFMSNGSFGAVRQKLTMALQKKRIERA